LPKITTSDVIGLAAAVVSVATIFIAISHISVPVGLQRFLGKSFVEQKLENVNVLVKSSVLLIVIGMVGSSITILIAQDWISNYFGIDSGLIILAILLVISSCFTRLFRAVVISSLKTKILPVVMIISGLVKIILAVILVSMGTGVIGVIIGYIAFFIVSSILLAITVLMILKTSKKKAETGIKDSVKKILNASVVSWIPGLITIIGINLGTIVVFGTSGASLAGIYFIAFSISTAITAVILVFLEFAYPLLSGMHDGRKTITWKVIKVSLVFGLPIVSVIMFYSKDVLNLFGDHYVEGFLVLEILLISVLPLVVGQGVRTLVYAYGNYRQVLSIGIALSFPRIILYFILVPIYGMSGAAISFTIGSIIGFGIALIIARKIGFKIFWKELTMILSIPTVLAFVLNYFEIDLVIALFVIILLPYILFIRLGIITRDDLQDTLSVLPKNIATPTLNFLNRIAQKLNPSY